MHGEKSLHHLMRRQMGALCVHSSALCISEPSSKGVVMPWRSRINLALPCYPLSRSPHTRGSRRCTPCQRGKDGHPEIWRKNLCTALGNHLRISLHLIRKEMPEIIFGTRFCCIFFGTRFRCILSGKRFRYFVQVRDFMAFFWNEIFVASYSKQDFIASHLESDVAAKI